MDMRLTEEQTAAVKAPVAENLVSAAAGSGKTKVLSERITERITSGDTGIDRLLVVTFTRAAAAQMRERISQALQKELEKSPSPRMKRQLALVAGADICTIDSFCVNILKKNFFRAEVPPDFSIADKNEMKILKDEILSEVLEELYGEGDEDFLLLADSVGNGKNDSVLRDMILSVYDFCSSFEEPEEWLDMAAENHIIGSEGNIRLRQVLKEEAWERFKEMEEPLHNLYEKALEYSLEAYAEKFWGEYNELKALLRSSEGKIQDFEFASFKGMKAPPELKEEKDALIAEHTRIKRNFAGICSSLEAAENTSYGSYKKICALCNAVKRFRRAFTEEKISRKELEFSDCEYFALKALKNSEEAAEELRTKYDEIYIDEYQDTNQIQDAIFSLISRKNRGEPNLFIVGDVKQSIYRFRHSDPTLFAAKVKSFGGSGPQRKMVLSKNFRSRRDIIDCVNCVFEKVMHEKTAQVEYDGEHCLKYGAEYTEYNKNITEIYLVNSKTETEDDLKREQMEALVAVDRIKSLVESGFLVSDGEGKMRKARYGDFAVLTRTISNTADMIVRMFELKGIPCVCSAKRDFFSLMEIRTAVALLKTVDNPQNDIPLAAVMRSPLFSFSENELLEIRLRDRSKPFYENVTEYAAEKNELGEKCLSFSETLSSWRERSSVVSTAEFMESVLDESGFYSFVGALAGGEARQKNLRTLISLAASYERAQYRGLYSFVRYLEKTIEAGGMIETEEENAEDAVLITTIHKSKGLEFPIVILIGCGAPYNEKDTSKPLILNQSGGMALVETIPEKRVKFKTAEYMAVSQMVKRDGRAEQMRLFYVAMTRAMEKLILIASVPQPGEFVEAAEKASAKEVSDHAVAEMDNYLAYLSVSAFASPKLWEIHTVETPPPTDDVREAVKEREMPTVLDEEVIRRLSYVYKYEDVMNIPSKMSVSEIKRMDAEEDAFSLYPPAEEKRVPAFMQKGKKLYGSARGTAYHRALELLSPEETDVKAAVERFREKGLMTDEEAECIEPESIRKFLASPIAEMMRGAKYIMREMPFTVTVNASDVFEDGGSEKICVQGKIDCFFETKDGELVLLDFKTDRYSDTEEMKIKYKKQLDLYEMAVYMKFLQKCDKKYLYLFHNNDIIEM